MTRPDQTPTEKVTLEDLLRLKRAERPAPDFWAGFERDLRTKQLAAIIEKRPWWQWARLPGAACAIRRLRLPVGAAAALTLGFFAVENYRGEPPAPQQAKAPSFEKASTLVAVAQAGAGIAPAPGRETAPTSTAERVEKAPAIAEAAPRLAAVTTVAPVAVDAPAASAVKLTAMVPWGVGQPAGGTLPDALASSHLLVSDPQVASMTSLPVTALLADRPAEVAAPAVATAPQPSARDQRKARILDGLVLGGAADTAGYSRAVVAANDLNAAQVYDAVRRVGMGGDRFTLKF